MFGSKIEKITAYEAYSDQGNKGIEAHIETCNGRHSFAFCAPALSYHKSNATHCEGSAQILQSVHPRSIAEAINTLVDARLKGKDAADQQHCDSILCDIGKEQLPLYASAAISSALCKLGAEIRDLPLYRHISSGDLSSPLPVHCAASGSMRYGGPIAACRNPRYSFVAYDYPNFEDASYSLWEVTMEWAKTISREIGINLAIDSQFPIPKGRITSDRVLLELMTSTINNCGHTGKIGIQIEMAAGKFWDNTHCGYKGLFDSNTRSRRAHIELICSLVESYPVVIISDPLKDDDFEGFAELSARTGIQIVGDELFCCSRERFSKMKALGAGSAILLTPGLIGTVSGMKELAAMAKNSGWHLTICGAMGEDVDICDYAVALGCSTARNCGLSYSGNRLLTINHEIGDRFWGKAGLSRLS